MDKSHEYDSTHTSSLSCRVYIEAIWGDPIHGSAIPSHAWWRG